MRRSEQIDLTSTRYYHCMSRCVRRAFLCGEDPVTGGSFSHRREWVRDRLHFLADIFAIDICAYAVMSNHLHVVLHVDEKRADDWSDAEVVRRYSRLYGIAKAQLREARTEHAKRKLRLAWRERLTDISWMMRALNEYIARRANREDEVTGRFWEGRFRSQPLLDEEGLLACMAYVDLNPVRAGLAESIDESAFTSIEERLVDVAEKRRKKRKLSRAAGLAAFSDQEENAPIPVGFADYVALVEWTGRAVLDGKGALDADAPGLLERVNVAAWLEAVVESQIASAAWLGSPERLAESAESRGRRWCRGIRLARLR
ncbi:MAG: hypothetical protein AAGE52_14640 [Myxococcota bacterium]